jgi:hypothetical protein
LHRAMVRRTEVPLSLKETTDKKSSPCLTTLTKSHYEEQTPISGEQLTLLNHNYQSERW